MGEGEKGEKGEKGREGEKEKEKGVLLNRLCGMAMAMAMAMGYDVCLNDGVNGVIGVCGLVISPSDDK